VALKYLTNLNMEFGNGTKYKITAVNKGFAIVGIPCLADSFVQGKSSVLRKVTKTEGAFTSDMAGIALVDN
jgi:hypothetical protein